MSKKYNCITKENCKDSWLEKGDGYWRKPQDKNKEMDCTDFMLIEGEIRKDPERVFCSECVFLKEVR